MRITFTETDMVIYIPLLELRKDSKVAPVFSPHTMRVFEMVRRGNCDKDIAQALNLSVRGVKYHTEKIRQRLNGMSRATIAAAYGSGDAE